MIIDKLKQLSSLTMQEQYVADYMIENPQHILEMNAKTLAKASHTSASTVVRLCQKLNFHGYSEFKVQFVYELTEMNKQLKSVPYQKESTLEEIVETMPLIYKRAIDFTKTMMDIPTLKKIINLIKKANRIEIYGDGINYELAKMATYKFEEIGISSYAYTSANWTHVKLLEKNSIETIAFLISHTGHNRGMIDSATRLKESHIECVAIVGNKNSRLVKLCDHSMQIMTTKNTLEFSNVHFTLSIQYLFDCIIAACMLEHYDRLKDVIEELKGDREKWTLE